MLILGTNDTSSWLFQEAQKKAKGLRHIGCREEEVRGGADPRPLFAPRNSS